MKDDLIPLRDILKEIEFLHTIRDRTTFDAFKASSSDVRAASYGAVKFVDQRKSTSQTGSPVMVW